MIAMRAAEQLVARQTQGLALDVPQGHVDRPHGRDHGPAAATHRRVGVEPLPQCGGVQRVAPDQQVLHPHCHRVAARRLDGRLGQPRTGVRFADARDAFVRVDEHHDVVLRRRRGVLS